MSVFNEIEPKMDEWGAYNQNAELVETLFFRVWHREDYELIVNIFRKLPYLKHENIHFVVNFDAPYEV